MPVAVGIYLPFQLALPILTGGIIAFTIGRRTSHNNRMESRQRGVLFSSGAIAGESLTGVGLAMCAALGISRLEFEIGNGLKTGLTATAGIGLVVLFYLLSRERR